MLRDGPGARKETAMTIPRRSFLGLGVLAAVAGFGRPAAAHHGWRWTEDGNFELTGLIRERRLGNPHGLLTIDAAGETWTAEIGQPWRNARAGLTEEMLEIGAEITLSGHRAADPEELRMKAERVIVRGRVFDLYPNRS